MGSEADVGVGEPHPGGRLALPWLSEHRNIIRGVSGTVTALSVCSLLQGKHL